MDNKCTNIQDLIVASIDKASNDIDAITIINHIKTCSDCKAFHDALVSQHKNLEQIFNHIANKIQKNIPSFCTIKHKPKSSRNNFIWIAIAAILAIVISLTIYFINNSNKPNNIVNDNQQKQNIQPQEILDLNTQFANLNKLYIAQDVDGLISVLNKPEFPLELKAKAADYLAMLSIEEAIPSLENCETQWQNIKGQEPINPFTEAIKIIKENTQTSIKSKIEQAVQLTEEEPILITKPQFDFDNPKPFNRVDITTVKDLYFKNISKSGDTVSIEERWLKIPDYYKSIDSKIVDSKLQLVTEEICNKNEILKINHKDKTAVVQFLENPSPPAMVMGLLTQMDVLCTYIWDDEISAEMSDSINNISKKFIREKSNDKTIAVELTLDGVIGTLYLDPETGLINKCEMENDSAEINYSPIPKETFDLIVPQDYILEEVENSYFGTVLSPTGKPLENAQVSIMIYDQLIISTVTNETGNFIADIPINANVAVPTYFIIAKHTDFPDYIAWGLITDKNTDLSISNRIPNINIKETGELTLTMEPAFTIYGKVTDKNNEPISNATIDTNLLYSGEINGVNLYASLSKFSGQIKTDQNGYYEISQLIPFTNLNKTKFTEEAPEELAYTINITHDSYKPDTDLKQIFPDGEHLIENLDITMYPATVTVKGQLVDQKQNPLPYHHYSYIAGDKKHYSYTSTVMTDENGSFILTDCPAAESLSLRFIGDRIPFKSYGEQISAQEYTFFKDLIIPVGYEEGKTNYDLGSVIVQIPEITFEFEITDTNGNPVNGVYIQFPQSSVKWELKDLSTFTDETGYAVLNNVPQTQIINISDRYSLEGMDDLDLLTESQRHTLTNTYKFPDNFSFKIPEDIYGHYIFKVQLPPAGTSFNYSENVKILDAKTRQVVYENRELVIE